MALVSYSDSEGSDNEAPVPVPKVTASKPTLSSKTETRKIKVDLPTTKPELGQSNEDGPEQPPAKRARTAGAFGGFNSMLPAPKRAPAQPSGLKKGVSLKTSSEAAFSRAPPPAAEEPIAAGGGGADDEYDEYGNKAQPASTLPMNDTSRDTASVEVKTTGKATRFRPLSVANNKKKKAVKKTAAAPVEIARPAATEISQGGLEESEPSPLAAAPAAKPKKSLFSVQQEEAPIEEDEDEKQYDFFQAEEDEAPVHDLPQPISQSAPAPNALEELAADLNLTAAQRRHLFGRQGKNGPANIAYFNMDAEYANNEVIRQSGETVQHKAVKAVAPGKHSLQQLVNNARSNQDSIEDKWAEGRRNRGEGGSKYGWSNG